MNETTQNWMLIWLFCIAIGSCTGHHPKVNVTVDQCDTSIQQEIR